MLCEGVETLEQCLHMKNLGCSLAQGYYFSPPLKPDLFEQLYEQNNGSYIWAAQESPDGWPD